MQNIKTILSAGSDDTPFCKKADFFIIKKIKLFKYKIEVFCFNTTFFIKKNYCLKPIKKSKFN